MSAQTKTVFVAVDSSPRAPKVLATAVEQARAIGGKLVLFRAIGIPGDLPFSAMAMSPEDVLSTLEQRTKTDLNEMARTVPPEVPCETRVDTGAPWQAICHAAGELDASLIVIGSHGYSGFDRVLGTTASRVVNHADRSVLVVRALGPADRASKDSTH